MQAVSRLVLTSALALFAAGCATSSEKVAGIYVSPLQYSNYSCSQLAEEASRVASRVATVSGVQDGKATSDAVATGVAIVVFWPAAFLVGGDDQTTAELARLKGELEAIERSSVRKNCGIEFRRPRADTRAKPAVQRDGLREG